MDHVSIYIYTIHGSYGLYFMVMDIIDDIMVIDIYIYIYISHLSIWLQVVRPPIKRTRSVGVNEHNSNNSRTGKHGMQITIVNGFITNL